MYTKNLVVKSIISMVVLFAAIGISSASDDSIPIIDETGIQTISAVPPNVKITSFFLSNSATGTTPVNRFQRGQTIYFNIKYTLSAAGDVMRTYSNPTWPNTISSTKFFTTAAQPAGSYNSQTSFITSAANPTGNQMALAVVAVNTGNLAFKTVPYSMS